jgi:hypothetical protein
MIFASKSRKGFYDSGVHEVLPEDAVEISEDYHRHLLEGQAIGKIIDFSGDIPIVVDKPKPTVEELSQQARSKRDALLRNTDWTQVPDVPTILKDRYKIYRQDLRDVPQQKGFPLDITWPIDPNK